MSEVLAFRMQACHDCIAAGLGHIEQQVAAVEDALSSNTGLVFDLARTLVESVCRTVLEERGISYRKGDGVPKLFDDVTRSLPLLPDTAGSEPAAQAALQSTLAGLSSAIHGICQLRNAYGFASHGTGTPKPQLDMAQGLLAAQAADAIVGFLYRMHTQDRTPPVNPAAEFASGEDYNTWIDEQHELVQIFESTFRPSEVLFQIEPETWRIYRADFLTISDLDGAGGAA